MLPTVIDATRTESGGIFVTLLVTDSLAGMADGIFQFAIPYFRCEGIRIRH